jgi:hypothetical protein
MFNLTSPILNGMVKNWVPWTFKVYDVTKISYRLALSTWNQVHRAMMYSSNCQRYEFRQIMICQSEWKSQWNTATNDVTLEYTIWEDVILSPWENRERRKKEWKHWDTHLIFQVHRNDVISDTTNHMANPTSPTSFLQQPDAVRWDIIYGHMLNILFLSTFISVLLNIFYITI